MPSHLETPGPGVGVNGNQVSEYHRAKEPLGVLYTYSDNPGLLVPEEAIIHLLDLDGVKRAILGSYALALYPHIPKMFSPNDIDVFFYCAEEKEYRTEVAKYIVKIKNTNDNYGITITRATTQITNFHVRGIDRRFSFIWAYKPLVYIGLTFDLSCCMFMLYTNQGGLCVRALSEAVETLTRNKIALVCANGIATKARNDKYTDRGFQVFDSVHKVSPDAFYWYTANDIHCDLKDPNEPELGEGVAEHGNIADLYARVLALTGDFNLPFKVDDRLDSLFKTMKILQ